MSRHMDQPVPEPDDGQQAMFYLEREQHTIDALLRCLRAGAATDDIAMLAAQLGIGMNTVRRGSPLDPDQTRTRT